MKTETRYPPENPERAVRIALDRQNQHEPQWVDHGLHRRQDGLQYRNATALSAPVCARPWDAEGLTTAEHERMRELEREDRDLRLEGVEFAATM